MLRVSLKSKLATRNCNNYKAILFIIQRFVISEQKKRRVYLFHCTGNQFLILVFIRDQGRKLFFIHQILQVLPWPYPCVWKTGVPATFLGGSRDAGAGDMAPQRRKPPHSPSNRLKLMLNAISAPCQRQPKDSPGPSKLLRSLHRLTPCCPAGSPNFPSDRRRTKGV